MSGICETCGRPVGDVGEVARLRKLPDDGKCYRSLGRRYLIFRADSIAKSPLAGLADTTYRKSSRRGWNLRWWDEPTMSGRRARDVLAAAERAGIRGTSRVNRSFPKAAALGIFRDAVRAIGDDAPVNDLTARNIAREFGAAYRNEQGIAPPLTSHRAMRLERDAVDGCVFFRDRIDEGTDGR